jgi:hypothetical protein
MHYVTSLLNYSVFITEGLDSTVDSSSGLGGGGVGHQHPRRATRSSLEEANLKRSVDDELDILLAEYEKAREDSVKGLTHLK